MKRRHTKNLNIKDVNYVSDAIIVGHLQAAILNFEYAAKQFKRHHFDLKDSNVAQTFALVRGFSKQTLNEFCEIIDEKIYQDRASSIRER